MRKWCFLSETEHSDSPRTGSWSRTCCSCDCSSGSMSSWQDKYRQSSSYEVRRTRRPSFVWFREWRCSALEVCSWKNQSSCSTLSRRNRLRPEIVSKSPVRIWCRCRTSFLASVWIWFSWERTWCTDLHKNVALFSRGIVFLRGTRRGISGRRTRRHIGRTHVCLLFRLCSWISTLGNQKNRHSLEDMTRRRVEWPMCQPSWSRRCFGSLTISANRREWCPASSCPICERIHELNPNRQIHEQ